MNQEQPPYQPPEEPQTTPERKSLKLPITLMVWPTAALIIALLLYALLNLVTASFAPQGDLYGQQSPLATVLNIVLFVVGAAAVLLGPISFIVGLVLLIQRKKK